MTVRTENAKNGTPILMVDKDEKQYRMNSAYQPEKEAERFAQQYKELEEGSVVIVFGHANGIFPAAINQMCSNSTQIIYYEPSVEILKECILQKGEGLYERSAHVQYVSPIENIAREDVCSLQHFPEVLDRVIDITNYKKVEMVVLPKYREIFPDEYDQFFDTVQYHVQKIQMNIATAKGMGQSAIINNIRNLSHLEKSYCMDVFTGTFPKEVPVILVSAGPSLEKNVEKLKQATGHAMIICVDSAAKYLLKNGIMPDVLVTVDPRKPLSLFDADGLDGIPIVASTDSNYKIFDSLPNSKIIFASSENEYVQDLYQQAGHDIHRLKSGGSVATFAFSLCVEWGFRNIILVGQDLALTDMQRYAGEQKITRGDRELIEVPDINGNIIFTVRDYYYYLKWFEEEIALHSDLKVIDATEGGAMIHGTEIKSLQDTLDAYCNHSVHFVFSLDHYEPAFMDKHKKKMCNQIVESGRKLYAFCDELEDGIKKASCMSDMEKKGMHTSLQAQKIHKELLNICDRYNVMKESFFIQRQIDAEYLEEFMKLFQKDDNAGMNQYEKLSCYFKILRMATGKIVEEWSK